MIEEVRVCPLMINFFFSKFGLEIAHPGRYVLLDNLFLEIEECFIFIYYLNDRYGATCTYLQVMHARIQRLW